MTFAARKLLLLLGCGTLVAQTQNAKFQHVVVIFQENRTPDNLFQGLCAPPFGSSESCSTNPTAGQYDLQTNYWRDRTAPWGVINPTSVPLANQYDLSHAHSAFVAMCNADPATGDCRMDGAAEVQCSGV